MPDTRLVPATSEKLCPAPLVVRFVMNPYGEYCAVWVRLTPPVTMVPELRRRTLS